MSHTPGPWKALLYDESVYVTASDCHIYSIDGKGKGYHPETIKMWHDNARLIAAAPDLLHALNELMNLEELDMGDDSLLPEDHPKTLAYNAIAKATEVAR
jgi:hypothetical protein